VPVDMSAVSVMAAYYPTNSLNYVNCSIVKNTLKI